MKHGYSIKFLMTTGDEKITCEICTINCASDTLDAAKCAGNIHAVRLESDGATILDVISF